MPSPASLEQARRLLEDLSGRAAAELRSMLPGTLNDPLVAAWVALVERYGDEAADIGADMFDEWATELGLRPRIELAPGVNETRASARFRWAMVQPNALGTASVLLDELVKQPFRSTVQDSARRSGGAWARVPAGADTCSWCRMLAGRGAVYRSEDLARYGMRGKKYHGECVIEGTLVHGPTAEIALRRKYEGRVATLTTTLGHDLTVTPNHPILTRRGWVPAGQLREGDDLLAALPAEGHVVRGPNEYGTPTRVEDRLAALGMVSTARWGRVPGAPEQFHGDGKDSEVDVVARNGLFWDEVQASFDQPRTQHDLASAAGDLARLGSALDSDCTCEVLRGFPMGPTHSRMGTGHLRGPLFGGHSRSPQTSRRLPPSGFDASFDQPAPDDVTCNAAVVGDSKFALAREVSGSDTFGRLERSGTVAAVSLLRLRFGQYSGHVYNLATEDGWYFANSIVTHNCDCVPTLVRGPEDYPEGYDPAGMAEQYDQARKDAGSGDVRAIAAAMRERFGGH